MKRLILILFCLPFFLFSQEKKKYEKTMSISQFAQELKAAADKGVGYTLKNCYITYDPIRDKEHVLYTSEPNKFVGDMIIKGIKFNDTTEVVIEECKFGQSKIEKWISTIRFHNCHFGNLYIKSIDVGGIYVENSKINSFILNINKEKKYNNIRKSGQYYTDIRKSEISHFNTNVQQVEGLSMSTYLRLDSNKIKHAITDDWEELEITQNTITSLRIEGGDIKKLQGIWISNNTFNADIDQPWQIRIEIDTNKNIYGSVWVDNNLHISNLKAEIVSIRENTFKYTKIQNDTIFNKLLARTKIKGRRFLVKPIRVNEKINDSILKITSENYSGRRIYNDTLNIEEKVSFLKQYFKENKLTLKGLSKNISNIFIRGNELKRLQIWENKANWLTLNSTEITQQIYIKNQTVDSAIFFFNNSLPDPHKTYFDEKMIGKLGFTIDGNTYYGTENINNIDTSRVKGYINSLNSLISQYRQIINIFDQRGDPHKSTAIMALKDIQTNQKMFLYYQNPNIENWFNWKGAQFLKWYSDYGTNPFKALAYCFWAMLYFAMFYFIFYNDWDKIDRGFLIKKFNNVMDYFTTEKRIEDFYSSTHDKEMTTFTEFKETLDKNKVYMPTILASLAKPIYQISLFRYKLLNFSYQKAEFMAGRKWVDLEKKEKYWIGVLTFFLTLTYIIYLVFIRALNSIVLSINAFSTLGFGQIPVRGFTKYVAIIEGFIGWFLLSIFLVSVLSQMMSV
mgnify:CR=1 FL=1|tara:strand:+ start:7416 stop:9620 length:2205 start_codon:yes stop_codon:yes gene_type:complete